MTLFLFFWMQRSKMNYRAWNHCCWLVSYMTREQVLHELKKSRNWAGLHVADNCCFHYRRVSFLMNLNKLQCKFGVLSTPLPTTPQPHPPPKNLFPKRTRNLVIMHSLRDSHFPWHKIGIVQLGKIYTKTLKDEAWVHHSYYF